MEPEPSRTIPREDGIISFVSVRHQPGKGVETKHGCLPHTDTGDETCLQTRSPTFGRSKP